MARVAGFKPGFDNLKYSPLEKSPAVDDLIDQPRIFSGFLTAEHGPEVSILRRAAGETSFNSANLSPNPGFNFQKAVQLAMRVGGHFRSAWASICRMRYGDGGIAARLPRAACATVAQTKTQFQHHRSRSVSCTTRREFVLSRLKLVRSRGLSAALVLDEIAEVGVSVSPTGDCSEIGCCAIFKRRARVHGLYLVGDFSARFAGRSPATGVFGCA